MQYERDWFIETMPEVKKLVARSKAEGRAEGRAEGKAEGKAEGLCQGLQEAIVKIVRCRFPALASLAQQSVSRLHASSQLEALIQHLVVVSDEESACKLLRETTA